MVTSEQLTVAIGQFSDRGRKPANQDAHGARIPSEPLLGSKGVSLVVADGISSSAVSELASRSAVATFLEDYYATPEAWSVKTSCERVLVAINSFLHSQTQRSEYRYEKDRGYVCAVSALVIKTRTAHVLHAGDARVYRLDGGALEQLTRDHRLRVSDEESYLSRALGAAPAVELDYHTSPVEAGATFVLATDGVYEHVSEETIAAYIEQNPADLDRAAELVAKAALDNGSPDNLTIQIVRVAEVPPAGALEVLEERSLLPFPPPLEARMKFDGFLILRELHASNRSQVYLAMDAGTGEKLALKVPAVDLRQDEESLERFLFEDWIARRIDDPHVLKPWRQTRSPRFVYSTLEYVEGRTLAQWMRDNPRPDLETVRCIIEQIAKGLRAFHRLEMLHQDLRPENVLIDETRTIKIIDFGSVEVAGLAEIRSQSRTPAILGALQYAAPEYFLGEPGSVRSDLFSLAVIAYELLSGRLPYGAEVPRARTEKAQRRLVYRSVLAEDRAIPGWVDHALKKALHPNPSLRYAETSEFLYDLRHPAPAFLNQARAPLLERNPVAFWRTVSLMLAVIVIVELATRR